MNLTLPSPLEPISLSPFLDVFIKRDDLIHPYVSGNKYRKLIGYFEGIKCRKVITYGGPFSNHLHATAAYCFHHQIPCKVYVRGLDADLQNPTLKDIQSWNAEIELIDRNAYRRRKHLTSEELDLDEGIIAIPEGGWGEKGFLGMSTLTRELTEQIDDVNAVILPVGSGTTLIALAQYLPSHVDLIGIRTVKDDSLEDKIKKYASSLSIQPQLLKGYEWKGFARYDEKLIDYMQRIENDFGLSLDFIYNAKAFYALEDLIGKGFFREGSKIIYLHTGGLQGNRGLEYRQKKKKGV